MEMTLNCEQVIYTWAATSLRTGYQAIARSFQPGAEDIRFMESYGIPAGLETGSVHEIRRFFRLPSGTYVYNFVQNIGEDTMGRAGILMSHMLLLNRQEYLNSFPDPSYFEPYYMREYNNVNYISRLGEIRNGYVVLPKKVVNVPEATVASTKKLNPGGLSGDAMTAIISAILNDEKKVILSTDKDHPPMEIMWSILRILPKPLRDVSFSTHVSNPGREPICRLVSMNAADADRLTGNSGYFVVKLSGKGQTYPGKGILQELSRYLAGIAVKEDLKSLESFHMMVRGFSSELSPREALVMAYREIDFERTEDSMQKMMKAIELSERVPIKLLSDEYEKRAVELALTGNNMFNYLRKVIAKISEEFNGGMIQEATETFAKLIRFMAGLGEKRLEFADDVQKLLDSVPRRNRQSFVDVFVEKLSENSLDPDGLLVKVMVGDRSIFKRWTELLEKNSEPLEYARIASVITALQSQKKGEKNALKFIEDLITENGFRDKIIEGDFLDVLVDSEEFGRFDEDDQQRVVYLILKMLNSVRKAYPGIAGRKSELLSNIGRFAALDSEATNIPRSVQTIRDELRELKSTEGENNGKK